MRGNGGVAGSQQMSTLASQLPSPEALWTIIRGAFLNEGQSTALQLNQDADLEDQGGDGVPRQEHYGEGLQEVQVPDRGCRRC